MVCVAASCNTGLGTGRAEEKMKTLVSAPTQAWSSPVPAPTPTAALPHTSEPCFVGLAAQREPVALCLWQPLWLEEGWISTGSCSRASRPGGCLLHLAWPSAALYFCLLVHSPCYISVCCLAPKQYCSSVLLSEELEFLPGQSVWHHFLAEVVPQTLVTWNYALSG